MAEIDSYKKFRDYCLRALGDGAIVINVTEAQIEDRISDALIKWQDFHFEGTSAINFFRYLTMEDGTKGYIDVPELQAIKEILSTQNADKDNLEVMDDIDYNFHLELADNLRTSGTGGSRELGLTNYFINMESIASMRYLFSVDNLFTFNSSTSRLYLQNRFSIQNGAGNQIKAFDSLDPVWTPTNGALTANDTANSAGDLTGATMTDTSGGTLANKVSYTVTTKSYMRGLWTGRISLMQGTYTGLVTLRLKDRAGTVVATKEVQPKSYWDYFYIDKIFKVGHINDFVFEIETSVAPGSGETFHLGDPSGFKNNFLILVGYQVADPNEHDLIWNSGWLKEYATALIQRQWALNLGKYSEIQMAGGVTLNSETMYDRADTWIEKLNEELDLKWGLPPAMIIG